ncbi:hypothetical protein DXV75_03180 [Alteromonas aestuariivivens]|uniref:Glycoside hydrolase family 5 domain-containing protein n=2 Tax=Alteromonas aestuariivivens TaxID=1938339 RepID=A0A3D8MBY5_9ALTE|nr:hypothetical protein DXV75_03180 [Alteromonas aestuariivivens]
MLVYGAFGVSLCSAKTAIGVNVNGLGTQLEDLSPDGMLARSGTVWVRMFVDMSKHRGKSLAEIQNDPSISNFKALHSQGYKTIINLKWATKGRDFPGPDTQGRLDDFDVMRKVLASAGAENIDIVVVGNEPFRETNIPFRDQDMTDWYKRMANEIKNFRTNNSHNFDIYMGAFNNLHKIIERTTVLTDLMQFAKNSSWIAGIDLHTHHENIEEWQEVLDYASSQIRPDQDILVTEFSLMRWFKSHNAQQLATSYANKYYPEGTTNQIWQELLVLQGEKDSQRWHHFNAMHDFANSQKHYLKNVFRDYFHQPQYPVRIATFALRQNRFLNYNIKADAWIYNGIFCFSTCSGEEKNFLWSADFTSLPKQ